MKKKSAFDHVPFLWRADENDEEKVVGVDYFSKSRTELFRGIGDPGSLMLDVGCGAGATSAALRENFPNTKYYGVEMNPRMAAMAAARLDGVVCCNFENQFLDGSEISSLKFDTILFADVLEHMYNPWKVLDRVKNSLNVGGKVVASIPNIFNLQVLENIASGVWNYNKWGILDFTHIRFFTYESIIKMFNETGYDVSLVYGLPLDKSQMPSAKNFGPTGIETESLILKNVGNDVVKKLQALQFVVVAYKSQIPSDRG